MENEELELGREVRITKKGDEREGQVGRVEEPEPTPVVEGTLTVNGKSYRVVPVEAKK